MQKTSSGEVRTEAVTKMTHKEALDLYATVRYNLPYANMKEAVDVAFEALKEKVEEDHEQKP